MAPVIDIIVLFFFVIVLDWYIKHHCTRSSFMCLVDYS